MKKFLKRMMAFIISLTMIVASFPIASYAQESISKGVESVTDTQFVSGVGLNSIANNLGITNDSNDYSISYLEVIDNKAYLKINNAEECTLVVAIYDENTLQMLASDVSTIEANVSTVEIDIEIDDMPNRFLTKAFLLDENKAALCNEYVDNKNTTDYEKFLAKTPADFSNKNIVYFSENEDIIDFGVLNNSVEIQDVSQKMTFSYDKASKEYTFSNATNDVKSLTAGEIFYYPYGQNANEFLLFKVAKVSVSGNTVTVTEDENIDLKDAFSFIRIDEDGDYSNVEIDESQLGEAFTTAPDSRISTYAYNEDTTNSFSETFNVEWPKESDESYKSAHVEGQLSFTISTSVILTYDPELFGENYYEFKSETTFEFGLSNFEIVGKISLPDSVSKISTAPIPIGPFTLTPSIKFIFSVSASLGLSAVYKETITVSGDSTNGVKKHTDADKQIDADSQAEVEIKIGAGAELKLSLVEIVALSVSGEFGIVFKGTLEVTGKTDTVIHPCYICIYGEVNSYAKFDVSLSVVLLKDVIDYRVSFINLSVEKSLGDMHISVSENGLDCGSGKCSRIMTKATFKVQSLDYDAFKNIPIAGAKVTIPGGAFDADGDGEYNETYCKTDEKGEAHVFLYAGEYTATIKADNYFEKTIDIKMLYTPKIETVVLSEGEGGKCGDNLTWTFNKSNGVLTISGTGDMYDYKREYEDPSTSPWCQNEVWEGWDIKRIVIENGVTSIGNHAFDMYYFHEQETLSIPDSVKRIGEWAFSWNFGLVTIPANVTNIENNAFSVCNCEEFVVDSNNKYYSSDSSGVLFNKNKTILIRGASPKSKYSIPSSVTHISDYAFSSCYIQNITIPNSVISIGACSFHVSGITEIKIPDSVTNMGERTFEHCYDLKKVTIGENITSIGEGTFSNCYDLESIVIPSSVTIIERAAFNGCNRLTDIYYTGTQTQWNNISIDDYWDEELLNATIHFNYSMNSTNSVAAYSRMNVSNAISKNSVDENTHFEGCVEGNKYILLNVYGCYEGFTLTEENLYYIDCITADQNGMLNILFIPKQENSLCSTVLIGDFGSGVEMKVVNSPMSIRNPSTTTISYGDSIVLHADLTEALPTSWYIEWTSDNGNFSYSVSADGATCTISPSSSGDTTFTATAYDANGNVISSDEQVMTSKVGLFDKIIAFFKKLFGLTKTIPQVFKRIF